MQPLLPRRRNSLFFAPSQTRFHQISQPVPLTKVETKNPQTHPGSIIVERMGAGMNQLTISPNPNHRLNFTSGISWYLAHILCAFLFLSLGREFPQGGLLWQRILCFNESLQKGIDGQLWVLNLYNRFYPWGGTHCFSLIVELDCIELASPSLRRK